MQKLASTVKIGDCVNVPNVGWRTLTHVRRSRRYAGYMQLQWAFVPETSCQSEVKATDMIETRAISA